MRDFVAQRYNLLLCSTIIETGIDVPTANTIVISRADKFGLAQLHQLRGRVGRSHHQAYAYLMVPDMESLTKQAQQRLDAIQQMEELGSGFYLAMHDLEIRGAGEVLGESQSGNMLEVGFQLYNEMLSEAVRCLKAGKEPDLLAPLNVTTDINLHAPALLPDDYCGDVHLRLSLLQEAGHRQEHRADRRPAGGNRRPLRQIAAAGPDPDRRAPPARHRQALRRGQGRCGAAASSPSPSSRMRRSTARASSSWCRRTATSSWPATRSCASSANCQNPRTGPRWCATCCARSASPRSETYPRAETRTMNMNAQEISPGLVIQSITAPLRLHDFKLIAFDMDSTLINIECVDEIADAVGRKAEVAAITEAAMRGEITDFKDSLRRRVALLKGVTLASMARGLRRAPAAQPGRRRADRRLQGRRHEGAAGLAAASPSSPTACASCWPSTSPAPTCWKSRTACSPAA